MGFIDTEGAIVEPECLCVRSCVFMLWFLAWGFYGTSDSGVSECVILNLFLILRPLSLYWVPLPSLDVRVSD